jgi:putative addiction module component (TIGR02574 family)
LTPEILEELERRLQAYDADPSAVRPWEDVRKDIFGR